MLKKNFGRLDSQLLIEHSFGKGIRAIMFRSDPNEAGSQSTNGAYCEDRTGDIAALHDDP